MSSDDEVCVVYNVVTRKWCVHVVQRSEVYLAFLYGSFFDTFDEAMDAASKIEYTEYGIFIYSRLLVVFGRNSNKWHLGTHNPYRYGLDFESESEAVNMALHIANTTDGVIYR